MYSKKTLEAADAFAVEYEQYVRNRNWTAPEILYNQIIHFLKPGDHLLDIGIGTGLASKPFKNAGLHITGVDGSPAMLEICRKNNNADELHCIDFAVNKLDFGQIKFQAIISCAVFHMIKNPEPIFNSIKSMLRPNGIVAFTVIPYDRKNDKDFSKTSIIGIYERVNEDSGIMNFRHSKTYISGIAKKQVLPF